MISVSMPDDSQYRKPLWSALVLDLVRNASRPTQDSLDDAHMSILPKGKDRLLFRKPNRAPRAVRQMIAQAQRPNNIITHSTEDKTERDSLYQEYKRAGRQGVTKYSTSANGKTLWVVAWPRT